MVRLGPLTVSVLPGGSFALDGGAMFGVVPRVLWEKTAPPDARNRVRLAANVTLVEAGGRRVLVDTGLGDKWTDRERETFAIERGPGLLDALREAGASPEDVDFVVNTHLHFDHAGGNTRLAGGRPVPAFPRARYVVQRGEWEDAHAGHERSRASYRAENYDPLADAGQLELIEGERELVPGVRAVPVGGHTRHHQMVVVEGGGRTLVVPTDLVPTTSHLPLPWVMAYDLHPYDTVEAKRRLLARAAAEGWLVVFYHDPRTAIGRVAREGDRYTLLEGIS